MCKKDTVHSILTAFGAVRLAFLFEERKTWLSCLRSPKLGSPVWGAQNLALLVEESKTTWSIELSCASKWQRMSACRILGSAVILLAAGNVFLGLHIGQPDGTHKFVAGYIAFLAVVLAASVIGTIINMLWVKKQQANLARKSENFFNAIAESQPHGNARSYTSWAQQTQGISLKTSRGHWVGSTLPEIKAPFYIV